MRGHGVVMTGREWSCQLRTIRRKYSSHQMVVGGRDLFLVRFVVMRVVMTTRDYSHDYS